MSSDYFSREKRGGVIAANIEHQDAVAAILSVDLLNRFGIFEELESSPQEWTISLESLDDLVISIAEVGKYYIQVKNQIISPEMVKALCARFDKVFAETADGQKPFVRFVVCAIAGVSSRMSALPTELVELKNSRAFLDKKSLQDALSELGTKYGIPSHIAERLQFDVRRIIRDDPTTFAVFAHAVRRLSPIDDVGDFTLELIFRELINEVIAPRRRERGSFSKKDLMTLLGRLRYRNSHDMGFPAKWTESGYSMKFARARDPDAEIRNRGVRRLMWVWRKAFFRRSVLNLLIGRHGSCSDCGHPLMGRFSGLNGIQCPDCGFLPCVTFVAFCSCGGHVIVRRQPPTSLFACEEIVSQYILEGDRTCSDCGQELPVAVFAKRCGFLPIPWPPDEYLELGLSGYMRRYHAEARKAPVGEGF